MMSLQRGQSSKPETTPMISLVMPMLIESAKELLADKEADVDAIGLVGLVLTVCKKIYGKLWKRGQVGLAVMLEKTGWMEQFVQNSIKAVAENLSEERGDVDAED